MFMDNFDKIYVLSKMYLVFSFIYIYGFPHALKFLSTQYLQKDVLNIRNLVYPEMNIRNFYSRSVFSSVLLY